KEYDKTIEADRTGHLSNIPKPHAPKALLWVITIIAATAFVVQVGWLPPSSASGGVPGASGQPTGSGGPAGSGAPAGPGGSGAPAGGGAGGAAFRRPHGRREGDRQERHVRGDPPRPAGQQAVHDRLRQRGPGHAA